MAQASEACCCEEAVRVDIEILCASISLTTVLKAQDNQPAFRRESRCLKSLRGFVLTQTAPRH
jgi:hypothetical protein